jgi:hypothetical protein
MAAKDSYSFTVSTGEGGTTLEVHGSLALIRQLLQTLWGSPNGTDPAHRGARPSPHAAKPGRPRGRRRKRRDTVRSPGPTRPVPVRTPRKCIFCANIFEPAFSGSRYCSAACQSKAYRLRQRPTPQATDTVL